MYLNDQIFLYVKGLEIPDMARMIGQQASQELSDSQSAHITSILVAANSNLAMCHLKLKNYSKVIKFASKAIEMDSKHQKARFRRALAYIEVKDIDAARADLNIALDQCPQDKAIIRALKRLDVVERNLNLSAQRKLAGIFDRVDLS